MRKCFTNSNGFGSCDPTRKAATINYFMVLAELTFSVLICLVRKEENRWMRSCILLAAVASLCGCSDPSRDLTANSAMQASLKAEYKALRDRYAEIPFDKRGDDAGKLLRKRMSELCRKVIDQYLPIGSTRERVLECLGKPDVDLDDALLYYGDELNWVHWLSLKDGKLAAHTHSYGADSEVGR
jgi:hypothetical protein